MRQRIFSLVVTVFTVVVLFFSAESARAQYTEKVIYAFTGKADGGFPYSNLISDAAGNLYGTTTFGGNSTGLGCGGGGCGLAYELSPVSGGGWTETVLYAFGGGTDGANPVGGLIFDGAGNLYGTTSFEGSTACVPPISCGTVFKLTPTSGGGWTESVIYSFKGGKDGGVPSGSLVFDKSGNLYGTTVAGGGGTNIVCLGDGCGTVFELTPSSGGWKETVLHAFTGGKDGAGPSSALVFDAAGNLYGTTNIGGMIVMRNVDGCPDGCGVVFKLAPATLGWRESVLHTFTDGNDGASPWDSGVIFDAAGNLYGTASISGSGMEGVVFKLTPGSLGGWIEAPIHSFSNTALLGAGPTGGLTFDQNGNLYGVTNSGYGGTLWGSAFELKPTSNGWRQSVLYGFPDLSVGAMPRSSLTLDAAGNLYGTTIMGGANMQGVVYELSPVSAETQ